LSWSGEREEAEDSSRVRGTWVTPEGEALADSLGRSEDRSLHGREDGRVKPPL